MMSRIELHKVNQMFLDADKETFESIYENWSTDSKNNELYSEDRCFPLDGSGTLKHPIWLQEFWEENKIEPNCCGVDLPVYVDNKKPKTIAVFGINPLRNAHDWQNEWIGGFNDSFLLGSAWAHHVEYWQKANKQLFKGLSANYNLYLSDIQKWFFKTTNRTPSHKLSVFNSLTIHIGIVEDELEEIKPDYILLIGGQAAKYFKINTRGFTSQPLMIREKNDYSFIIVPHTSAAVRNNLRKNYAEQNKIQHDPPNIGRDYAEMIQKNIS